jgi:hypothetical protein
MAGGPHWDEAINSEGDTCRSLIEELAAAPAQNVLGLEVVSFSMSRLNRDYLVAAIRHLIPNN